MGAVVYSSVSVDGDAPPPITLRHLTKILGGLKDKKWKEKTVKNGTPRYVGTGQVGCR